MNNSISTEFILCCIAFVINNIWWLNHLASVKRQLEQQYADKLENMYRERKTFCSSQRVDFVAPTKTTA